MARVKCYRFNPFLFDFDFLSNRSSKNEHHFIKQLIKILKLSKNINNKNVLLNLYELLNEKNKRCLDNFDSEIELES